MWIWSMGVMGGNNHNHPSMKNTFKSLSVVVTLTNQVDVFQSCKMCYYKQLHNDVKTEVKNCEL